MLPSVTALHQGQSLPGPPDGCTPAGRTHSCWQQLPRHPLQDLSQLCSMTGAALHLMGRAIFLPALRAYPPSLVAATLLYCARQNAGTPPLWPTSLIELTGECVACCSPPLPPMLSAALSIWLPPLEKCLALHPGGVVHRFRPGSSLG